MLQVRKAAPIVPCCTRDPEHVQKLGLYSQICLNGVDNAGACVMSDAPASYLFFDAIPPYQPAQPSCLHGSAQISAVKCAGSTHIGFGPHRFSVQYIEQDSSEGSEASCHRGLAVNPLYAEGDLRLDVQYKSLLHTLS